MNVMESDPAAACTTISATPLNVDGRSPVIDASLQEETCKATGPGYATTWHPEHSCPKPTPLMVMLPPDATTNPDTFGSRGPTEKIAGLNLQRNIEKVPPVTANGPQVLAWFAVLVAVKVPVSGLTNSL
jgi:hypothetical protein